MPCQSYESSWARNSDDSEVRKLKKEADKLARIACKALTELEENGVAEVLLLKDDEVREWWAKHQEDDRKAAEALAKRQLEAKMRKEALSKLTDEEKRLLGIKVK